MIKFITYGCKLNQSETAKWRLASSFENKNTIVINSCSVTSYASKEIRKKIRHLRKENPDAIIYLTGCFDKTIEDVAIDNNVFVIKREDIGGIWGNVTGYDYPNNSRAFIAIQTGCNRFCRYCIVPYLREKPVSYSPDRIKKDIEYMIKQGYQEMILTGTHIGLYRYNNLHLSDLIEILKTEFHNDIRLRLGSLEVFEIDEKLMELFDDTFLCKHVHLSLQTLSTKLLYQMGRNYTFEDIEKTILYFNKKNVFIGTDIIIGYPLETDGLFEENIKHIENLPISFFHFFRYSQRENTVAALIKPLDTNLITLRQQRLNQLSKKKKEETLMRLPKEEEILIEKIGNNKFSGRLSNYITAWGEMTLNIKEKQKYTVNIINTEKEPVQVIIKGEYDLSS